MGLDMYLERETFIGHDKKSLLILEYPGVDPVRVREIIEEAGYWRKANHIHGWFVRNVQDGKDDCGRHYVSEDQRKELLNLCKRIVGEGQSYHSIDGSLASEELPVMKGFFFGFSEPGEWYFDSLLETIKFLEPTIGDDGASYYYHSSW